MTEEKNLPLVSVIVPCYNHEKYVKETIESILKQTYKNIELIVIDDGSKDNSVSVIQELGDKYGFTFIHRPNKGLSATLNEAIKLTKGEFICICASDDIFKLDKIEKQVKFMDKNPKYKMCFGKAILFNNDGQEKYLEIKHSKGGWIFNDLIINKFYIPATTVMIRKDIFLDIGYFDEELWVEDWDMWVRIANKYEIGYLNEYLTYYRQHETNISKQAWKLYEAKVQSLKKWENINDYNKLIKIWQLKWFRMLSSLYKNEAKKYISIALKNPFSLNSIIGLIKYYFVHNERLD